MLKDHSVHLIATYALLILASPLILATKASAQSATCPVGYVCTVYQHTQVSNCPTGYVCTPSNSASGASNTGNSANSGTTYSNGYYIGGSGYTVNNTPVANTDTATTQTTGATGATAASCYVFRTNLGLGSMGPDVVALQRFLIYKGYNIPNVANGRVAAGNFGANTVSALRLYQSANGINENGQLGPLTRAKINSLCSTGSPATPPDSTVASAPVIVNFSVLPSPVVEGQNVTFTGTARQGSSCIVKHRAIVVGSQTPPAAAATERWTTVNCLSEVTLSGPTSTTKNPYAFNGPGTYKVVWQIKDRDGREAGQERTVVITASNTISSGPSIVSFNVSPASVTEGQNMTWTGYATGGSVGIKQYRAYVVGSNNNTGSAWTPANGSNNVSLNVTVPVALNNPRSFHGSSGRYIIRFEVEDLNGRFASSDRDATVGSSTSAVSVAPDASSGVNTCTNAEGQKTQIGSSFSCYCYTAGTNGIWGTNPYSTDSPICTAARHAGRFVPGVGKMITYTIGSSQVSFAGSETNGVISSPYPRTWASYSF